MYLFQTDQKNCYDESGKPIPCYGTCQDGAVRAGPAWPVPRFVSSNQTVKDRLTGLVWLKDANLSRFPLSWDEAFDYVRDLNMENRDRVNSWRLPSRHELFTMVSHARINPSVVRPDLFSNLFNGYYWTGTSCARYPDQAWCVHLGGGRVIKGMKHASYMIWPVCDRSADHGRTGLKRLQENSTDRFVLSQDIAADRKTGLAWTRQADAARKAVTWQDALNLIRVMNQNKHFGFSDWRLPNIRELESLVDDRRHSPAISFLSGLVNIRSFYWSATTSVFEPSYAWALYTDDGNIGVGYKNRPEFHVWPTRSSDTDIIENTPGFL